MAMRLGKHPKKYDRRTFQLGRYLPRLPQPPAVVDHASRLPVNLGMMGNDQYGDCVVAAAGHMVQSWSVYAERGLQTISDAEILAAYRTLSPLDTGAYLLDGLNLWRKTGIGPDKIEAFVETAVADLVQAKLAIYYFGSCYIGMSLPDVNTFGPWTTPTGRPNPSNGHAVNLVAYDDARQMFRVCTWGEVWDMSYAWFKKYSDESFAVLNDLSLIQASGATAEGFDWPALLEDLKHVGDPVGPPAPVPVPVPVPPPVPPPVPVPTPPVPVPVPVPEPPVIGGTIMQLKSTVRLLGLRPELIIGILVAQEVFRSHGGPLILTTGIEGTHATAPPSEHFQGNAIDFRVKHLPLTVSSTLVFQELVLALGGGAAARPPVAQAGDFEVRLEDLGTENAHGHLAFRPNRPLVTPK